MLQFLGPVTRAMFSFSTAVDAYSMVQLKEPIFVSQSSTWMTATMGEGGAKHYGFNIHFCVQIILKGRREVLKS